MKDITIVLKIYHFFYWWSCYLRKRRVFEKKFSAKSAAIEWKIYRLNLKQGLERIQHDIKKGYSL